MKRYALILLALLPLLSGCSSDAADKEAVRKAFDAYKTAILAGDGDAAAASVSQTTLDQYQKYVDWALHADRATVQALPLLDKMQVLTLRHRIPHDKWQGMTGESAFIYAVNNNWIGKNQVEAAELGDIYPYVVRASADVIMNKKKTRVRFFFLKEKGAWKFDLVRLMEGFDAALKAELKRSRVPADKFILDAIGSVSGNKPTDAIWEPIQK
jgi:hypothetical protein